MYRRLLCMLGTGADADRVLQRAITAREQFSAQLFLLRVVEFLPVSGAEDAMLATPLVLADQMEAQAREQMQLWAQTAGLPAEQTRVAQGDLMQEAERCVQDWDIDLIVLGKHERHGFSSWFNQSEDDILHGSRCDLLAVHLTTTD